MQPTTSTRQWITTGALGVLLLGSATAGCGPWVAADRSEIQPAARAARLEELHRVHRLERQEAQAARIERLLNRQEGTLAVAADELARRIIRAAEHHDLDPLLVLAVVRVESAFQPTVISRAGAVGLMQVLPYVGRDVARRNGLPWQDWRTLQEPAANLRIGSAYLAELLERFDGRVELALAAYNMGPTLLSARLARGWRPHGPYVPAVLGHYRRYVAETVRDRHWARLVEGPSATPGLPAG